MRRVGPGSGPSFRSSQLSDGIWTPVLAVIDETRDIRTFRLARPRGFDFRAGQQLSVDVPVDGAHLTRCYSISSAPESIGHLDISVKKRGRASAALHEKVGPGSLLSVRPPEGSFVYPDGDQSPLVLIAGGEGCAPLMSMVRHAVRSQPSRSVTLLLSVRTAQDFPFRHELGSLVRQHPQVRAGVTLTRESRRHGFFTGRIDEALLRRAAPCPAEALFYICGPPPMVSAMRRLLKDLGVPAERIRSDASEAGAPDLAAVPSHAAGPASPAEAEASSRAAAWGLGAFLREEEIEERIEELLRPRSPLLSQPLREPNRSAASAPLEKRGPASEHEESRLSAHILRFPANEAAQEIPRFLRGERMLHWSIAIPFLVCFTTGVILKFFFDLHPEGLSRDFLALVHRVAGGCLAVFPSLAVLRNWRDYKAHLYNIKVGWTWTLDDVKWLFLMGPATFSKRIVLPDQRKFNAAERLNFMMVMSTYPAFVATGLSLWMPGIHFLAWVAHVSMALAAAPLVFGHMFMACVNPSTRIGLSGMITGHVDREWARHHYARWYRENFEEDGTPKG